MKIYVIIPVFDAVEYLKQAVDSVLEQDFRNLEIVLVDDGSVDGSSDLCDALKDAHENIHVIHQKNGGVSIARNTGINFVNELASGECEAFDESYVTFLDSDDVWIENSISEEDTELFDKRYDLIGFQSCEANSVLSRRSQPVSMAEGKYTGGRNAECLFNLQHFGAMLYNLAFLKNYNLRFYPMCYSEDKIFRTQALYLAGTIFLENRLFYVYRQNRFSAMHRRPYGILYYQPVIDGWLQSDHDMEKWRNKERGILEIGTVRAKRYLIYMMEEHFQYGGTAREWNRLLENRQEYQNLLKDDTIGDPLTLKALVGYEKQPVKYRIYNRLYGIVMRAAKKILKSKVLRARIEKRKYPIKMG